MREWIDRFWVALVAGVVSHGGIVSAQTDPNVEYYKEPGQYPTRSYVNQHFNEHIDPHTGRLQHHYVDLFIPGNGGLDLKIQRSYSNVDENSFPEVSPVGVGWTMHFGRILRSNAVSICDVDWAGGIKMPVLELPDGSRQILFRDDAYGAYFPGTPNRFITTNRWRAECMTNPFGIRVFAPDGTQYEMTHQSGSAPSGQQAWYTAKIIDRNGNSISVGYQTVGFLDVISGLTASDGRVVNFNYTNDSSGVRLSSITDGTRTWQYGHVFNTSIGGWLLMSVTPPAGGIWAYTYRTTGAGGSGVGSMASVTYPQGGTINYSYVLKTFVSGLNPISNIVVAQKTTSDGGIWTFSYTPSTGSGSPDTTTVTASNGTTIYQHEGYGTVSPGTYWMVGLLRQKQLISTQNVVEQTETYAWTNQQISLQTNQRPGSTYSFDPTANAPLLQQRTVVRNGNAYTTVNSNFDNFGNPQIVTESSSAAPGYSRTISLTYQVNTGAWIVHQVKDESFQGFSTTRNIDSKGNVLLENRFGVPTSYTYDSAGNVATRTDARGFVTGFQNYWRGIARTENRPDGISLSRVVSDAGNVTSETDGKGDTVGYAYDFLNRLTAINYPVLNDVEVTYPTANQMRVTRGTLIQTVNYDGFGRTVAVAKADGQSSQNSAVTIGYNALGQRTFLSNPNTPSVGTNFTYDMLDRVKTVSHPDQSIRTYSYGATTITIQNERVPSVGLIYSYRAFGDPDKRELMAIDVPAPEQSASIVMQRNAIGRITSVAQGGVTRTYGYNAAGQFAPGNFLTSIVEPETGTTVFGRDAMGNMTSRTVGNSPTTTYTYDELNRLAVTTYPGGQSKVTRFYYGDGRLASVESSNATLYFDYDGNKNLTREQLSISNRTYSVTHTYAGNDGRSTTTFLPSGSVVTYSPNAFGRPTSATPFVSNVDFHPSGELASMGFANGVTTSISINNRLWPQQLATSRSGTPIVGLNYGYDGAGNVVSLADSVTPARSIAQLQYDNIDRLVMADTSTEQRRFSYDGAGNIRSQTIGGTVMTYAYDGSNLLTGISNAPKNYAFAYDTYRNVVSNGTATFNYNDAQQMVCAKCGQPDQLLHDYDGLNMRVRQTAMTNGVTTYFLYGLDGQLILEDTPVTQNGGARTREYVYLHGRLVGVRQINRAVTTTSPAAVSYSGPATGSVAVTVNVTGNAPTGTVTFYEGNTFLGIANVVNGSATLNLSGLHIGTHTLTAQYSGDANNGISLTTDIHVTIYDIGWLPAVLELLLSN